MNVVKRYLQHILSYLGRVIHSASVIHEDCSVFLLYVLMI